MASKRRQRRAPRHRGVWVHRGARARCRRRLAPRAVQQRARDRSAPCVASESRAQSRRRTGGSVTWVRSPSPWLVGATDSPAREAAARKTAWRCASARPSVRATLHRAMETRHARATTTTTTTTSCGQRRWQRHQRQQRHCSQLNGESPTWRQHSSTRRWSGLPPGGRHASVEWRSCRLPVSAQASRQEAASACAAAACGFRLAWQYEWKATAMADRVAAVLRQEELQSRQPRQRA